MSLKDGDNLEVVDYRIEGKTYNSDVDINVEACYSNSSSLNIGYLKNIARRNDQNVGKVETFLKKFSVHDIKI